MFYRVKNNLKSYPNIIKNKKNMRRDHNKFEDMDARES